MERQTQAVQAVGGPRASANGEIVVQGVVFTWLCESPSRLKVYNPKYGVRVVERGRHYQPVILAKLVAIDMLCKGIH